MEVVGSINVRESGLFTYNPFFLNVDFCTETRFVCFLFGQYLFLTAKMTRCHFISAKIAK